MDDNFRRSVDLAREKFIDPAVQGAIKDEAGPLPPLIFAQFFAALIVLTLLNIKDKFKAFPRYRAISEQALRDYLIRRNIGQDGRASDPS